jgi:hypothetical protein
MFNARQGFGFDLERDVHAAQEMAAGLKPYVYEKELYGFLPGDLPRLTVGGLLMRLRRLWAVEHLLTPDQKSRLHTAQQQFEAVRKEWSVAYEGKLQQELQARIKALFQYLGEYGEDPRRAQENYLVAMEKRVMVELLAEQAAERGILKDSTRDSLTKIDNLIRRYFEPGDFNWDARLEVAYPREKYWYLYLNPAKPQP